MQVAPDIISTGDEVQVPAIFYSVTSKGTWRKAISSSSTRDLPKKKKKKQPCKSRLIFNMIQFCVRLQSHATFTAWVLFRISDQSMDLGQVKDFTECDQSPLLLVWNLARVQELVIINPGFFIVGSRKEDRRTATLLNLSYLSRVPERKTTSGVEAFSQR